MGRPIRPSRLVISADAERLADVRAFVRSAVSAAGGSPRASEDLVQAVDEVVCNVIVHGYRGARGEIEIRSTVQGASMEISILDRAPTFDPAAEPGRPDGGVRRPIRPGGMGVGLELVRTMTDRVRHDVRPGGGNVLTVARTLGDGTAKEG